METHEGVVERFVFDKPTFKIGTLAVDSQTKVKFKGPLAGVRVGDHLSLSGVVEDSKYGPTLNVKNFEVTTPRTRAGVENWLGKLVGPVTAKRLCDALGDDPVSEIEKSPALLQGIEGIGPATAQRIRERIAASGNESKYVPAMLSMGVPSYLVGRIVERYGTPNNAYIQIVENPYELVQVEGVGFKIADKIALANGFSTTDPRRYEAGALQALEDAHRDGHCYLTRKDLNSAMAQLVQAGVEATSDTLLRLEGAGLVVIDGERVYRQWMHALECRVAERLKVLAAAEVKGAPFEPKMPEFQLAPQQVQALDVVRENGVSIITGGPGVGKTTVLKTVLTMFSRPVLMAPTGKAAKRMEESTGVPAYTVHRKLGWIPGRRELDYHKGAPLPGDIVVIDEFSMVDIRMAEKVLDAVRPGCRLLIVGDQDQLPSVGPGSVLGDLIESQAIAVQHLTVIHRQGKDSHISKQAHRVNAGEYPVADADPETDLTIVHAEDAHTIGDYVVEVIKRLPKIRPGIDLIRDVWTLAPQKKGPCGVEVLNERLRDALNPHGAPLMATEHLRAGDRVMQMRNDYDLDVFNGDSGIVIGDGEAFVDGRAVEAVDVDIDGRIVSFPKSSLGNLKLAYASTIHKSQGSQSPVIVMAMHQSAYMLLKRPLLYTGMTRAEKLLVLIGSRKAIGKAVATVDQQDRKTGLVDRLREVE